ncbi:MAG: hypothetical protein KBE65_08215 [Phycisphaerae bacterium]|nr:hypothetical protein [Phycisphaerae bacterium]
MMTFIPAAIVLLTLTNASGSSAPAVAYTPAPTQSVSANRADAEMSSLLRALNARTSAENRWVEASQKVFVVPTPDSSRESLAQVAEDMVVMCRIIDKAISPSVGTTDPAGMYDPYVTGVFERYAQTQGLYLDGYGALFFIEVDFLLVRPVHEQEQPETEPSGDAVWSQTRDELDGVPQQQPDSRTVAYNAQKVENLKSALVRTLRHASNLRVRGAQDRIAVVITSRCRNSGSVYTTTPTQPLSRAWGGTPSAASTDMLVLQTTKSDVDTFAKGDLTVEQFTEKVQVLTSWTGAAGQPLTSTGVALPSSGPSGATLR